MKKLFQNISIYFTAGVIGSLVKLFFITYVLSMFYTKFGIKPIFGDLISYKVLIFGGLWGMLFFIPAKNNSIIKILVVALIYALYILLYYIPLYTSYGIFAKNAGIMTILSVFVVSLVWATVSWFYTFLNK